MKVLLVDNLVMPEQGMLSMLDVHPHLGLLSIAAAAEADGHRVVIYDPKRLLRRGDLPYDATLYERVATELLAQGPEVIGFTTLGCSFLFAVNVARLLKEWEPELPVLLGGPHATMLHRSILERFPQFDVVVRHEADETFASVLARLETRGFHRVPGLSWRGASGIESSPGSPRVENLDALPMLSYDHYPVSELQLDLMRIEAGRGCPFDCTFCSTASFFQRTFRIKSAERLVAELDRLHGRYGCSNFKLDHDLFTVNRRKVLEFAEAVEDRGYRWQASARVDCVDPELLRKMARAGCVGLYFGIETGSERMQRVVSKRLHLDLVVPTIETAEALGIDTTASFITGYPEETESDQEATLNLLGRCYRKSCLPQLHVLAPEPGTPLFEQLGGTLEYDGYQSPFNAHVFGRDDERLVRENPDIFPNYHYYPAAIPRSLHRFAVESVSLLRSLGPLVLRYLLRMYRGKLSELVSSWRLWTSRCGRGATADSDSLLEYVEATFGRGHHLASLVRYSLLAERVSREPAAPRETRPLFDPCRSYRRALGVHILSEIHDCEDLLARIGEDPDGQHLLPESPVPGSMSGELGVLCMVRAGDGTARAAWMDAGAAAILGLFERPREAREVAARLRVSTGAPESVVLSFLSSLVEAEVLVPAERRSSRELRAPLPPAGPRPTHALR